MNYSKALRVLRAAKGISQQDLALQTRLSKSLLSKIEAGFRKLSQENKEKVAQALQIPVSLFDILALEPRDKRVSRDDLEQVGHVLLSIQDEISRMNEKSLS